MTKCTTARAGRFHQGRLSEGRPQALDAWRVTTDDADVAARIAGFLGGEPQTNGGGSGLAYEVLTSSDSVRVIMDGPAAVAARMVLRSSKEIIHECDGSQLLSPAEKKGQSCGCPPLIEDKRLAARSGRGPMPSTDLTFRIAGACMLGEFHFTTSSWQLASQLSDLTDALERVDGPAVCDLTMELVVFTTKAGERVCYRKPVVTVLGSPSTVAPEAPPTAEPPPAPAPSARRREARRAPEPAATTVHETACSVAVDTSLLHRAAQVLGTSDHQETVMAALSEVLAQRRQAADLARLQEHVGRIAAIAEQALQGPDSPLA
ncbi:recombination directionality factor [Streptomyces sp. BYX5S]